MLDEIKRIHDRKQRQFNNNMAYWTEQKHKQELLEDRIDTGDSGRGLYATKDYGNYHDAVAISSKDGQGSTIIRK